MTLSIEACSVVPAIWHLAEMSLKMPYHATVMGFRSAGAVPGLNTAVLANGWRITVAGQAAAGCSALLPPKGTQLQLATTATAITPSSAAALRYPTWRKMGEPGLEAVMGPVAERRLARGLATAEPELPVLLRGVHHRRDAGALVRAVAERLSLAASAGAPEIALARFDGDAVRRLLRWDRSVHLSSPPSPLLLSAPAAQTPSIRAAATLCEARPTNKPGRSVGNVAFEERLTR